MAFQVQLQTDTSLRFLYTNWSSLAPRMFARRTERDSMSPAGMDLRTPGEFNGNLPSQSQPPRTYEQMVMLGRVNEKLGKNTLHSVRIPVNAA